MVVCFLKNTEKCEILKPPEGYYFMHNLLGVIFYWIQLEVLPNNPVLEIALLCVYIFPSHLALFTPLLVVPGMDPAVHRKDLSAGLFNAHSDVDGTLLSLLLP